MAKNFFTSYKRNIARNIILSLVSLGGIISIIIDNVIKEFLPDTVKILVTFITILITVITILAPMLDYYTDKVSAVSRAQNLKDVLHIFGIKVDEVNRMYDNIDGTKIAYDLLNVIASCIHKGPTRYIDGRNEISTQYYIYTLSAAHLEDKLKIMTAYMCKLIAEIRDEIERKSEKNIKNCYFLIVPFGRNVLLGESIADNMHLPILISQIGSGEKDNGGQFEPCIDSYEYTYQKFVGMDSLEEYARREQALCADDLEITNVVFHGIILDCNTTRGSAFVRIANHFNERILPHSDVILTHLRPLNIRTFNISFSRIQHCATLFLAADSGKSYCESVMRANKLELKYYFELTENAKKYIFDNRDRIMNPYVNPNGDAIIKTCAEMCNMSGTSEDLNKYIKTLPQ